MTKNNMEPIKNSVTLRRKKHFNKREYKNIKLKLLKTIKIIKL